MNVVLETNEIPINSIQIYLNLSFEHAATR